MSSKRGRSILNLSQINPSFPIMFNYLPKCFDHQFQTMNFPKINPTKSLFQTTSEVKIAFIIARKEII